MAIEVKEIELDSIQAGKVNFLSISGKLDKSDYALFVPTLEEGIERHGKINLLVELHDFHGWSAGAVCATSAILKTWRLSVIAAGRRI